MTRHLFQPQSSDREAALLSVDRAPPCCALGNNLPNGSGKWAGVAQGECGESCRKGQSCTGYGVQDTEKNGLNIENGCS